MFPANGYVCPKRTLQRCEESGGNGHRQYLNRKALTEVSAEERNIPKNVHFIGDGYPRTVTGSPFGTGEVPCCAGGASPFTRSSKSCVPTSSKQSSKKERREKVLCVTAHTN